MAKNIVFGIIEDLIFGLNLFLIENQVQIKFSTYDIFIYFTKYSVLRSKIIEQSSKSLLKP